MKVFRWIFVFVLVLGVTPLRLAAQDAKAAQKALTNQDVVDLVKTGLSPDIVVAKIRTSACQFDTSTAALKELKDSGVPDSVIVAMVDPSNKTAGAADPPKSDAASSDSAHVRIYRPRFLPAFNFNPPIYVDGKEVFRITNASRCSVRVSSGHHTITSNDKSSKIEIDAKAGQEFFISVQEVPGGLQGRGKLTMVANEQGKPEYKLEKPLQEDKKTAKEMLEDDAD